MEPFQSDQYKDNTHSHWLKSVYARALPPCLEARKPNSHLCLHLRAHHNPASFWVVPPAISPPPVITMTSTTSICHRRYRLIHERLIVRPRILATRGRLGCHPPLRLVSGLGVCGGAVGVGGGGGGKAGGCHSGRHAVDGLESLLAVHVGVVAAEAADELPLLAVGPVGEDVASRARDEERGDHRRQEREPADDNVSLGRGLDRVCQTVKA